MYISQLITGKSVIPMYKAAMLNLANIVIACVTLYFDQINVNPILSYYKTN